jgi:hypothetical protein
LLDSTTFPFTQKVKSQLGNRHIFSDQNRVFWCFFD